MVAMEISGMISPNSQSTGTAFSNPSWYRFEELEFSENNASILETDSDRRRRYHQSNWVNAVDAEVTKAAANRWASALDTTELQL